MQTRRGVFGLLAAIPFVASCTNGSIDPVKVADALKAACGIAVPLATIAAVINASIGGTVASIVDLLCSGYHQALAGKTGLAAGGTVEYDVTVNGHVVHVVATKS